MAIILVSTMKKTPVLRAAIDAIGNGDFSHGEQNRYRLLMDNLLNRDHYLLLADFAEYCKAQERVDEAFEDKAGWAQKWSVIFRQWDSFPATGLLQITQSTSGTRH